MAVRSYIFVLTQMTILSIMNKQPASYFKNLLLLLYPCKVPFTLNVLHTKPKTRCGTYYSHSRRININDGGRETNRCIEIAIHEYAHHLHYTEFAKEAKKQDPHGPAFWQIYGQLVGRAKALGLYEDANLPIIVFPDPEDMAKQFSANLNKAHEESDKDLNIRIDSNLPPNIKRCLKALFKSVYLWLNRG